MKRLGLIVVVALAGLHPLGGQTAAPATRPPLPGPIVPPSQLGFAQAPTAAKVGVAIAPAVRVQLLDKDDTPVGLAGVAITMSLSFGTGALSGTLTQTTDTSGIASFADLTIDTVGLKQLTAASPGLTSAVSDLFAITAGPPSRLAFVQQPTATAAGQHITPAVTVKLQDAGGNDVFQSGVAVTVSRSSGTGTLSGTLTQQTNGSGVATFSDLAIDLAGPKQLAAASTGLASAVSATFTISAGAPSRLAFVQQPSTATSGQHIAPAVTVQLADGAGNAVARSGVAVSVALTSGGGTLAGTLTQQSDATGLATFSDLAIDLAGTKQLTASSTGLTAATSGTFNITAGAPSLLGFVQQPTTVVAGQRIAPPVTVQLLDGAGNASPQAGTGVQLALSSGSGALGGTLTRQTDASGLAAFADLSIDQPGSKQLTATSGSLASAVSAAFTVQSVCTVAPVASFTYAPAAVTTGLPIRFTDTSTGTPTSWSWSFQGGSPATSSLQNPVVTFVRTGAYTVTLTVSNCKGSDVAQQQVRVVACSRSAAPVPMYSAPVGPMPGFPEQWLPIPGHPFTFKDLSSNDPVEWSWSADPGGMTSTEQNAAFVFPAVGNYNVTLIATNCAGSSVPYTTPITVYQDNRQVTAAFSWSAEKVTAGSPVTWTAGLGLENGDPDSFTWDFGDGPLQSGPSVTHTFACGGPHVVKLTASRSNYTYSANSATRQIQVAGTPCRPEAVMTVDLAKLPGLNGTSWRTDVRMFNPSQCWSSVRLQFLPVAVVDNSHAFTAGPYPIAPYGTLVFDDVIGWANATFGTSFTKTALRVTYDDREGCGTLTPVVMSRTYTPSPGGGTYGQFAAGVDILPNASPSPVWLTGLRNNGVQDGFRSNYSMLSLRDPGTGDAKSIGLSAFDESGVQRPSDVHPSVNAWLWLGPFTYLQDSFNNLFYGKVGTIGTFSVKVDVPAGVALQAYASVIDNRTGAPVLIPAVTPPTSPIYLPAVAHNPGLNGTIWRSDLQVTNPATAGHIWEVKFLPRGGGAPVTRPVTLAPHASVYLDDAIGWAYNGAITEDTNVNGMLRIAPADGSGLYPVVQARSYNRTPNGTFGQNITPTTAEMGVSATSANTRLVLAGMSSEDIARTNIGFVTFSESSPTVFAAYFYDESGNVLNPKGTDTKPLPYTFAMAPGGWNQDRLENRFRNAFGASLPAGLRAISAVVFVTGGGPGTVYATVIDNMTGDPLYIPAKPLP
ncbi:MAG TPA: PKD domain-containing protein [Thermoanaerobaculaceae bacterium]|nr:PKD domain-containing protein [Thermoanaerobaculaceae bacterium]